MRRSIESAARELLESFGFSEMQPPVLEHTGLFARSIGAHTDIVEKEMYTFPSSRGASLTLRPEATASVARAYIQHKMYAKDPVAKLYTIGPMFRKERPQKGRYRQFYQINAEVFGVASAYMDAQLVYLLVKFFTRVGVTGLSVHINSLGCPECRPGFSKSLVEFLGQKEDSLCGDCRRRKEKNPLRVLDCKVPGCREAMEGAPVISDFLCDECRDHFDTLKAALDAAGIEYELDPRLVRGLDYYTKTAFEIQTSELGAQNAVAGGGRYDGLVSLLGGPDLPAVGFAIGLDRLVDLVRMKQEPQDRGPDIFVLPLGEAAMAQAFLTGSALAEAGIRTEVDFSGRSLKALMRRANRVGAAFVLIMGENEIKKGTCIVKHLETGEQQEVSLRECLEAVDDWLKKLAP